MRNENQSQQQDHAFQEIARVGEGRGKLPKGCADLSLPSSKGAMLVGMPISQLYACNNKNFSPTLTLLKLLGCVSCPHQHHTKALTHRVCVSLQNIDKAVEAFEKAAEAHAGSKALVSAGIAMENAGNVLRDNGGVSRSTHALNESYRSKRCSILVCIVHVPVHGFMKKENAAGANNAWACV